MKTKLIAFAGLLIAMGGLLQTIAVPGRTNPPVRPERTVQANTAMPAAVRGILNKACVDCHTHETRWPWYARVAPLSWMMARDVSMARSAVNFSEWSVQVGRSPETATATLAAACADMRSGRMPLKGYVMMHPESRLSDAEIGTFCRWTETEIRAMLERKRNQHRDIAVVPVQPAATMP